MALVLAVGMLAVLSLMAGTMVAYSASNARSSSVNRSANKTLDLAEAGLARALSKLGAAPNATLPTLLPGETATLEGGSVTWWGILAGETWTITSVSTVKNPANGTDLTRTLTAKVQIGIDPNGNNAWNYVYSDAPATRPCMELVNSVNIEAPLFVRGNLCIKQTAKATGSLVKVGGTVETTNNGSIGTEGGATVPTTKVAGGCRNGTSGSFVTPCGVSHRVYTDSFSIDPGTLEKPVVDFTYWYAQARPGPMFGCTSSSGTVPVWDTNTTLDRPLRNVDIMPAAAYSCSVTDGPHILGKLTWTPDDGDADDYGNLEVLGTVFIDGHLDMSANRKAIYTGRGSIYVSGKITFGTSRQICGAADCSVTGWDPEQALLVLVSGHCTDVVTSCDEADQLVDGFEIGQSSIFQGAAFVVSDFNSTSTGQMQGPIIAHQLKFEQQGIANKWVPIEAMTMGTPGGGRKLNVASWAT